MFLRQIKHVKGEIKVSKEELKVHIYIECVVRNSNKTSNFQVEKMKPEFLKPSNMSVVLA